MICENCTNGVHNKCPNIIKEGTNFCDCQHRPNRLMEYIYIETEKLKTDLEEDIQEQLKNQGIL